MDACKAFMRETAAYTKENEPGTLMWMAVQEAENPTNFVIIQAYSDEAALERHLTAEPMLTNVREVLLPAIVDGPHFTHYTIMEAKMPSSLAQTDGQEGHSL
jgi:quinol monooxygenase YgiN